MIAGTFTLLENVKNYLLNPLIFLMFGLAVLYFVYGAVAYFWAARNGSEKTDEARNNMIWGIVGMAIMISVYGIMQVVVGTICGLIGQTC